MTSLFVANEHMMASQKLTNCGVAAIGVFCLAI